MLTTEQKAKWVEALRSGEYKQGQFALNRLDRSDFCCLGVLCEVLELPKKEIERNRVSYYFEENWHTHAVPDDILPDIYTNQLIDMNDSGSYTFLQIAYWIEEHVSTDGQDTPHPTPPATEG
jgi:hypothetical protein